MRIKVGGVYKIRDGGTIVCTSTVASFNPDSGVPCNNMRCVSETGEVLFYAEGGSILPIGGGKELAKYNVVGVVRE